MAFSEREEQSKLQSEANLIMASAFIKKKIKTQLLLCSTIGISKVLQTKNLTLFS